MNKIENLWVVFLSTIKFSRSYTVDLAIEQPRDIVYMLYVLLFFVFRWAASIPYIQAVILNLPQLYLRGITLLLDYLSDHAKCYGQRALNDSLDCENYIKRIARSITSNAHPQLAAVRLKSERAFWNLSSLASKRSSLAQNTFVLLTKCIHL